MSSESLKTAVVVRTLCRTRTMQYGSYLLLLITGGSMQGRRIKSGQKLERVPLTTSLVVLCLFCGKPL